MKPWEVEAVFEDTGGIALMGRGKSMATGQYFQQADFSAINLKVYDMADPSAPINGASGENLTIASVIFNSLQTADARWTKDPTGYNFLYLTKASHLPNGGRRCRFEFMFTPTAGADYQFPGVFEIPTLGLYRA